MNPSHTVSCSCGKVALQLAGAPILSVECLCSDCQQAAALLQTLPGAPTILDDKAATRFVLFRKDRVRCTQGSPNLKEHRLTADTKTRRVVATCCNTPVFLELTNAHWFSVYGGLWRAEDLPPLQLRTMCRDRPPGVELPSDVPNPATHTLAFMLKLVGAWAAMGFRIPKDDYVQGTVELGGGPG